MTVIRTRFTVWDGAVYMAVLMLAVLMLVLLTAPKGVGETVVISCGGETIRCLLSEDRDYLIENNGYTLGISIKDRKASVSMADCPDQLCRRMGEISQSGESIACLPAGVYVKIEGGDGDEADFVAG